MVLLDASALIAHLRDDPAAAEVDHLIRTRETSMVVVNAAEVIDKTLRDTGIDPARLEAVLEPLFAELLPLRAVESAAASRAGGLRAKHYDRVHSPLSLADCLLLAAAGGNDQIASSDRALLEAASAEGIAVLPLPDSSGGRVQ